MTDLLASATGPDFLRSLRSTCQRVRFAPGDTLRQYGHHYKDMYLLIAGSVAVDLSADGRKRLSVSAVGSPIGEIGFLGGCPATATVTAVTDTEGLLIDDRVLALLEREQPAVAAQLMRHLADTAEERVSYNVTFAATTRFAAGTNIEVLLCRNEDMLASAQRLRYEVYCGELGRNSPYADHDKKILADELDRFGHTFIAVERGEIIGTLRANISSEGPLGVLEQQYGMGASAHHPGATGVCTKLIVRKEKRGGPLALKLISAVVRFGLRRDIKECYIDCVPGLLHYYKALGFKISGQRFFHRENGPSHPMVLDLTKHGTQLAGEHGTQDYVKLFVKAHAIRLIDAVSGQQRNAAA